MVRAGVIELLLGEGVYYSQNCLQKNEEILSISTSPGRNFAVNC